MSRGDMPFDVQGRQNSREMRYSMALSLPVGTDDVVLAVIESEDDATRGVLSLRDRLELHRDVDVALRPGRDDHVEVVSRHSLHERALAARGAGDLLYRPLAAHHRSVVDAGAFEVKLARRSILRELQIGRRRKGALEARPAKGAQHSEPGR